MTMTKRVMIALIGCLLMKGLAIAQSVGGSGAKFAYEQEAMLAHYRKLHEEIRHEIDEVRFVLGELGVSGTGKQRGVSRLEDLSKRIAQKQDEFDESKRMISRFESKQKVIRSKIIRIERELALSLKRMPNDPVSQALEKLVEIDESASQRMKKKFESGQISSDELSNAERKLAESRLELAKHQWERSVEARKAIAAANSALEEAVFESEMQATESAELEKEIHSLKSERGRIEAFLKEEAELSQRAVAIEQLTTMIRSGNTEILDPMVEKLRKLGIKIYEPGKPVEKPAEPSTNPGK